MGRTEETASTAISTLRANAIDAPVTGADLDVRQGLHHEGAGLRETTRCDLPEEVSAWIAIQQQRAPSSQQAPTSVPPSRCPWVDGSYQLLRQLGRGAMGQVVLALDLRLEREVAIKFPGPHVADLHAASEQLRSEARMMARVHDPHVAHVHSLGGTDVPYLVMEYVPGGTLEALVATRAPLPLDEALALLDEICQGAEALHAAGVVHGDLKPGNLLLAADQRVVVADLGLARLITELAQDFSPEVAGTPAYVAPEVIMQLAVTGELATRRDVYALGVLAYLLLTGRPPFEASDIAALLSMHLQATPRPLRFWRPEVPAGLEQVVMRALEKDPALRLASAAEFRRGVIRAREFLASDPAAVMPSADPYAFAGVTAAGRDHPWSV